MFAGVICCTVGVGCFLAIAWPSGGSKTVSFTTFLPLAIVLAAVVAGCLAAARWGPGQARPLWLALACGVDFGVNAFLLKLVPNTLPLGFSDPLKQWPLYAIVITAPTGFLLNQSAFQAGTLISPVLAIITTADPLVSIGVAYAWLGETITSTPIAVAGEVVSLVVMAGGIYALAHRAPARHEHPPGTGSRPGPPGGRRPREPSRPISRRAGDLIAVRARSDPLSRLRAAMPAARCVPADSDGGLSSCCRRPPSSTTVRCRPCCGR